MPATGGVGGREEKLESAPARGLGRIERVAARRLVELAQDHLVAAVADVVDEGAVALERVRGAQDLEVGRVFDLAARVARGKADVGDVAVRRMRWIELAVETPGDAHIGPGSAEALALGKRPLGSDFYARYFSKGIASQKQNKKKDRASHHLLTRFLPAFLAR